MNILLCCLSLALTLMAVPSAFAYTITNQGVPPFITGKGMKSLPPHERRVTTIGDAVPVTTFTLTDPALTLVQKRPGHGVWLVVVRDPAVRTPTGIGIGSTFAEMRAASPKVSFHPVPPTYGNDACAARTSDLSRVVFYFDSCDKGLDDARTVTRIIIGDI